MNWLDYLPTIFTAGSTIILAYIGWKTWKEGRRKDLEHRNATLSPVASFEVSNLPPYSDENQLTEIIITNIGNCVMPNPMTKIFYSWGGPADLNLNWGEDNILSANETKIFRIRLPDPPLVSGEQEITIICMCLHPFQDEVIMEWTRECPISYGR